MGTPQTQLVKFDPNKPVQVAGGLPGFGQWLQSRKGTIGQVATSFMSPDRTIKVLMNCFDKNPDLYKCTGVSLWRSMMQAVELGLEPGGALGLAHLIPYKENCTLIIDYKGLEELCYRSGLVLSINAYAVFEGDKFTYKLGLNPTIDHEPMGEDSPAKITHAYCVVRLANGGEVFRVMTRKQIEGIRKRSRAGNSGPWVSDYEAMCCKTVERQTLKHCPKSTEVRKALAMEDRNDIAGREVVFDFETIDAEVVEEKPATHGVAAVQARMEQQPGNVFDESFREEEDRQRQ